MGRQGVLVRDPPFGISSALVHPCSREVSLRHLNQTWADGLRTGMKPQTGFPVFSVN